MTAPHIVEVRGRRLLPMLDTEPALITLNTTPDRQPLGAGSEHSSHYDITPKENNL